MKAQIGGDNIMKFLNIYPSSRINALGGSPIALQDKDPTLGLLNPALLNDTMSKMISTSYINYIADINVYSAQYTFKLPSIDSSMIFQTGILNVNHGEFIRADINGNITGTFLANDNLFYASASKSYFKNIRFGATLKFALSEYEIYKSSAIALDLGAQYQPNQNIGFGLTFRNIGYQLTTYENTRESLPFEINAGLVLKPTHAPLRILVNFHTLNKWDLPYTNPNLPVATDLATGLPIEQKIPTSEYIARHLQLGTELLLSKNFHIRLGYDHQRRKEMTIANRRGLVGYNLGAGMRINKFQISYGLSVFHLGASNNTFSVTTNLHDWSKKK